MPPALKNLLKKDSLKKTLNAKIKDYYKSKSKAIAHIFICAMWHSKPRTLDPVGSPEILNQVVFTFYIRNNVPDQDLGR
jgi:hypothetical protein